MPITYSISGGADAGKFDIDGGTGELTFKTAPDFENPGDANKDNIYEVTVKATDAGGASSTQDIKVTVKDVSENLPPQITSAAVVSVNENQTTVLTVTATDPDDVPVPPTPSGDWPDATNTGVPPGTVLTPAGATNITTAGTTFTQRSVTGTVTVRANNVTISKCAIDAPGNYFSIDNRASYNASGMQVLDCTVTNSNCASIACQIIQPTKATIMRCNISAGQHYIQSEGGNLIQDCYMHDLMGASTSHFDCTFYGGGGPAGDTIKHNTLYGCQTANVFTQNTYGSIGTYIVDGNQLLQMKPPLYGARGATNIYMATGTNCQFTNNKLEVTYAAYDDRNNAGWLWHNNTNYVTGAVIPGPGGQT